MTNNLALTPQMGWNDWNAFGCGISDTIVRQTADAMAANGMKAAGYQFVNIDDCWAAPRDPNGFITVNASKFPNGIKSLADYVHSKSLNFGLYTDHGTNTCSSSNPPGSYGYEYLDAMTYASWGVDYLKNDSCKLPLTDVPKDDYSRMADGLVKSGRPIFNSLCPNAAHYEYWSADVGNSWRTTGDIHNTFASMISKLDQNSKAAYLAGPGRWNDADMLEVGNGEFATNLVAAQTHFTMWCIMAAPLLAGTDLRTPTAQTLAILTNAEAIAVDQDPAGEQGIKVGGIPGSAEVWSRPLGYDFTTRAVALLNRATNDPATITCYWTNLALQSGTATVRDLWAHQDLGTLTNSFTATVPPYGSMLLKIVGTPVPPPALGTNYLTALQPIYAYAGFGAMTNNLSIGGNPLTLGGVLYTNGIGTHAIGGNEYNLGGICSRFQATVGVDDEVSSNGSVIFQVLADGRKIYDSGILTGSSSAVAIDLDLTGVRRLTIGVTDTGNDVTGNRNAYDHSDWAMARVIVTNTTPRAPYALAGLTAIPGNVITLNWNNTLAALTYNVKRATQSGGPYATLATVPITTFTDSNVENGTNYFYVVSSVSSLGESANSAEAEATACQIPNVPTNLLTTASISQVALRWNASTGAATYAVSRFTSNTPSVLLVSGLVTTNYTDSNVTAGATYYYMVTAANSCNAGAPSGFVPAVVPSAAPPAPPTWNGGSATGSYWSDAANWGGTNIAPNNSLFFDGNTRLNNTNDTAPSTAYSGLAFNPGAGAFVLNGNPITLAGSVTNNSANPQKIKLGLTFNSSLAFNGAGNTLIMGGGLTNNLGAPGSTTLTLAGAGLLTNLLNSTANPGGTNVILFNDAAANWTLLDNPSSAPATVPWVLEVNSGTFNFGAGSSAPALTTTSAQGAPSDNQVGAVTNQTGTFNIIAGTLTTAARLNTATASGSTGIVNQIGGTFNLGSQFQGANGANAGEVSILSVSGGTLNVGGGTGPIYVASRGGGTLTVSGSGVVNCGKLDISRNAAGNTLSSTGVVNLNGGTLMVTSVTNISANQQTGGSPTAAFNFNGGTLLAKAGSATGFFQGSSVTPITPITTTIKSGGAIIDDGGNAITVLEPLQHDNSLGGTPDGGLIKKGVGTLTMAAASSYTGPTIASNGTLAINGSLGNGAVSIISGATLIGNGTLNGSVTVDPGATLALGDSGIGVLTISNAVTLQGTTFMRLNPSLGTNDVVRGATIIHYGGTLILSNLRGTFGTNDSFKLFSASSYSGAFANIAPVIPAVNLAWNTNSLSTGTLSIVAAPTARPRFVAIAARMGSFIFNGTNGVPNWPYYVLISTNVSVPLNQWERLATNTFDGTGNFSFTNAAASALPQQYYLLQLQ